MKKAIWSRNGQRVTLTCQTHRVVESLGLVLTPGEEEAPESLQRVDWRVVWGGARIGHGDLSGAVKDVVKCQGLATFITGACNRRLLAQKYITSHTHFATVLLCLVSVSRRLLSVLCS